MRMDELIVMWKMSLDERRDVLRMELCVGELDAGGMVFVEKDELSGVPETLRRRSRPELHLLPMDPRSPFRPIAFAPFPSWLISNPTNRPLPPISASSTSIIAATMCFNRTITETSSTSSRAVVSTSSGMGEAISTLEAADCFGDIALVTDCPRNATVRAITSSTCLALDREHFQELLRNSPRTQQRIRELESNGGRKTLPKARNPLKRNCQADTRVPLGAPHGAPGTPRRGTSIACGLIYNPGVDGVPAMAQPAARQILTGTESSSN